MTNEQLLSKTIGFIHLGCDKNRVDLERMITDILSYGFKIENDPYKASIILINTCSFISDAKVESVNTILEMAAYKQKGKLEKLIVTGCLSQAHYDELVTEIPEVDAYVKLDGNKDIVRTIYDLYGVKFKPHKVVVDRRTTTPSHYAYLKIADGCNNHCTYCRIPKIRGKYISEEMPNILKEATALVKNGARELILVAQDVSRYGEDLYKQNKLCELITSLTKIDKLQWIRLLYCYPEKVTPQLIELIKTQDKICKYIDIPMQHASDRILKLMNRHTDRQSIHNLIATLRQQIPNISIRSTFIVGFPTETHKDFKILCDFLKTEQLNNVGFFMYSNQEDVPASKLKQVPEFIKRHRYKVITRLQSKISKQLQKRLLETTDTAIIDSIDGEYAIARTQYQTPDVDSVIYLKVTPGLKVGQQVKFRYKELTEYDYIGEIL